MKKRILSFVMVIGILASLFVALPMTVNAETEGLYTYYINYGEATITDCDESISGDIVIPDTLGGYPVTIINYNAFDGCGDITSVEIPDSVYEIRDWAFADCWSLESVTIPASVEGMGYNVFAWCCNITNIDVDDENKYYSSFDGNLFNEDKTVLIQYALGKYDETYDIPEGVEEIEAYAFSDSYYLTSINIPESVEVIGYGVFNWCESLEDINVDKNNSYYCSVDGNLFDKDKATLIQYAIGKRDTTYDIPEGVTEIEAEAFVGAVNLTRVTIPDGVTEIYDWTFDCCEKLSEITIPSSVTYIYMGAFSGCDSLEDVYYTGTEDEWKNIIIDEENECLTNATIHFGEEPGDPEILSYTIKNGEVTITDCKKIASGEIKIPSTIEGYPVTTIGEDAFSYCLGVTSVIIPEGVTTIAAFSFDGCENITSVAIPDSVTFIGKCAFQGCVGLTGNIVIPNGVTTIGKQAYNCCTGIESVNIPASVTSFGMAPFAGCENLTDISVDKNNLNYCSVDGNLFDKDKTTLIQYAIGKSDTTYTIPEGVTTINDGAFINCRNLISITIPDDVTDINSDAFCCCENLENITIAGSVNYIGSSAFFGCVSLSDVYYEGTNEDWEYLFIGNDNEYLEDANIHFAGILGETEIFKYVIRDGEVTIKECDYTTSGDVIIPSEIEGYPVTAIGKFTFECCVYVTSITIPESVTTIEEGAFFDCSDLVDISIPKGVTKLKKGTFCGCESLDSITIPEGVTSIGFGAFEQCRKLAEINIPKSVTSIGEFAFFECESLKDVYYAGAQDDWDKIAIDENNDFLLNATIHFGVGDYKLGDPNGDGAVDIKDVISIRRFITGGYGTEIVNDAADVNKDNSVDIKDAIMLRRFITGGYGVEF